MIKNVPQVITSRMRYITSQVDKPIRIVGLSTSLADAKDLGEWIGATSHALFNFPPGAYRPHAACSLSSSVVYRSKLVCEQASEASNHVADAQPLDQQPACLLRPSRICLHSMA